MEKLEHKLLKGEEGCGNLVVFLHGYPDGLELWEESLPLEDEGLRKADKLLINLPNSG
jgi:hypothetical protein